MRRIVLVEADARARAVEVELLRAAGYLVIGVEDIDLARAALAVSPHTMVVMAGQHEAPSDPRALHTWIAQAALDSVGAV